MKISILVITFAMFFVSCKNNQILVGQKNFVDSTANTIGGNSENIEYVYRLKVKYLDKSNV